MTRFKILTLNDIAVAGLDRLQRDRYEIASEIGHPDAILVRSADMHALMLADSLKAVGRAGVGVDNVDVAAATRRLLEGKAAPGVYHCVNAGFTTWHELAIELSRQLGSASNVVPVSADAHTSRVVRPKFAALSNEKLANLGIELPAWQSALGRALAAPRAAAPVSGSRPAIQRP